MPVGPKLGPRAFDSKNLFNITNKSMKPVFASMAKETAGAKNWIDFAWKAHVAKLPDFRKQFAPAVDKRFNSLAAWHHNRFKKLNAKFWPFGGNGISDLTPYPDKLLQIRSNEVQDLMKRLPVVFQKNLDKRIARLAEKGVPFSPKAMEKAIADSIRFTENRMNLIAVDQVETLVGRMNQNHQLKMGVEKYEWRTAADDRVRPTHAQHEGAVFKWDDPPAQGHPGSEIRCRCAALPIYDGKPKQPPAKQPQSVPPEAPILQAPEPPVKAPPTPAPTGKFIKGKPPPGPPPSQALSPDYAQTKWKDMPSMHLDDMPAEAYFFRRYSKGADKPINRYLRGQINGSEIYGDVQEGLPSSIKWLRNQKLNDENLTLYRGVGNGPLKGLNRIGDEVSDPAFLSTSTNLRVARGFGRAGSNPHLYRIRGARRGRKLSVTEYPHEAEVLLPPGTRLRLVGGPNTVKQGGYTTFEWKDGKRKAKLVEKEFEVYDLEVVGVEDLPLPNGGPAKAVNPGTGIGSD